MRRVRRRQRAATVVLVGLCLAIYILWLGSRGLPLRLAYYDRRTGAEWGIGAWLGVFSLQLVQGPGGGAGGRWSFEWQHRSFIWPPYTPTARSPGEIGPMARLGFGTLSEKRGTSMRGRSATAVYVPCWFIVLLTSIPLIRRSWQSLRTDRVPSDRTASSM